MNDLQFQAFIKSKGYKNSSEFNSNPKSLLRLINYVKNLPIQQSSFDVLYDLLKFFRTPLFIACQPLYQRLIKNQIECEKYLNSIQQIATYVKNYLEDYNLQQLKFFYAFGFSKKKKKTAQKSQPQKQFLRYIQNLGNHINKLKKQMNNKNPEQLKLQLDSILASGLQRKLNVLQVYYEQYFKYEADKIYKQQLNKIQQNQVSDATNKGLQTKPDVDYEKKTPLCCRTYFYDQQTIKQPENFTLEYKQYHFPFGQQQIRILKKTVCGFLNADGGIILLGIHEDTKTKKRKVLGMQLNEVEKQNFIFVLRKDIIQSIQPDILSNKIYSVCFVPVKQKNSPYHYISGRYVAKITIKFGLRNQIYSYRHQDKDYFAFRTQNEVIHRQGRDILNAYRQRLKNPLPIPVPLHEGSCSQPDVGNPIQINSANLYDNYNSNGPEKKKFKQKDAMDFILKKINQKDLLKQLQLVNLHNKVTTVNDIKTKLCFLKMKENQNKIPVVQFLSQLQSQGKCQFFESQRAIGFQDSQQIELAIQYLKQDQFKFQINQKKNSIEFKSTQEAVSAFQLLTERKFKINFLAK